MSADFIQSEVVRRTDTYDAEFERRYWRFMAAHEAMGPLTRAEAIARAGRLWSDNIEPWRFTC